MNQQENKLQISYVPISSLRHPEKNPRTWSKEAREQLKESITRYGAVDPLIINSAPDREGVIVGGNFRFEILKELLYEEVPVVHVNIPDPAKEAQLIIRLNKNTGDWDLDLLAEFDELLLLDVGFDSSELDEIFEEDKVEQQFDLNAELGKLNIQEISVKKGDLYDLDGSRLYCGDSTIESDMLALVGDQKVDMVMTDPPYRLQYLRGKT